MIFIKRALEYLKKKIGKTILLAIIFIVIANFIIAGLLIQNASENAQDNTRKAVGADIIYTPNFDQFFADFEKGLLSRSEVGALRSGGLLISEPISENGGPTVSNLEIVTSSNYVETYYYAVNVQSTSDIKAYQLDSTDSDSYGFLVSAYGGAEPQSFEESHTIIEGRLPNEEEQTLGLPVIVINDMVAKLNNLSVGDNINLTYDNVTSKSIKMTHEIIGIYSTTQTNSSVNNSVMLPQNKIYMPILTFETIGMSAVDLDNTLVTSSLIKLYDPENLTLYRSEMEAMIDFEYGTLDANDDLYNSLVGPLESIGLITKIFVVSIIITGGFIVGLITALTINDRKNEIGILLAVGESKIKIVSQLVLEVVIIAVIAFSLSMFTGEILGENLSNTFLDSEVFGETTEVQSFNVGNGKNGSRTQVKKDISQVKDAAELQIGLDLYTSLQIFGIGLILTIVSTSIPTIYVMRFSPKQILTNRNS